MPLWLTARAGGWLDAMAPHSVTLSCPYPADECVRRLTAVTTDRGPLSWYLDPRTAGRRDPRLFGKAGPPLALSGLVALLLRSERNERNRSAARLIEELNKILDSAAAGGPPR